MWFQVIVIYKCVRWSFMYGISIIIFYKKSKSFCTHLTVTNDCMELQQGFYASIWHDLWKVEYTFSISNLREILYQSFWRIFVTCISPASLSIFTALSQSPPAFKTSSSADVLISGVDLGASPGPYKYLQNKI